MNKNKEEKSIWEIIGNLVLFFLFIDAISDIFNIFNDNE
jgi:phosphate starvation-inducible membrane PsiE